MWGRVVDGRVLTFRLAGINNQNFLMRDEETGSWWQQISGKAVSGPLRGKQLPFVRSDELTFGLWRTENPDGSVLRPVDAFASKYDEKDWEEQMKGVRTVVDTKGSGLEPRELMLGVEQNGWARAWRMADVVRHSLIHDFAGGVPVIVVLGPDRKSVRVFKAKVRGHDGIPDFYRDADGQLMDAASGSKWNFQGCSTAGPQQGQCLRALPAIRDYWFDWRLYHPNTTVFASK